MTYKTNIEKGNTAFNDKDAHQLNYINMFSFFHFQICIYHISVKVKRKKKGYEALENDITV